eukprot:949929-Rhodomonas_salina.1
MGLTNSPSVFQHLVSRILGNLYFVEVFIDYILIHSADHSSHLQHIKMFFAKEVEFLGHVVSTEGISMEPSKTKAITDWPKPRDIHELHSFIGLANYYCCYIDNYTGICLPLFPLFVKNAPWEWTEAHTTVFKGLKSALTSAPVLLPFYPNAQSIVVTDASKFAIRATLLQIINCEHSPIAFYSRKLIAAEINYTTHEQELLAIRDTLKTWRHYLA